MASLNKTLADLTRREIGLTITSFPGIGLDVSIGDEMNGIRAKRQFKSEEIGELAQWLMDHADDPVQG